MNAVISKDWIYYNNVQNYGKEEFYQLAFEKGASSEDAAKFNKIAQIYALDAGASVKVALTFIQPGDVRWSPILECLSGKISLEEALEAKGEFFSRALEIRPDFDYYQAIHFRALRQITMLEKGATFEQAILIMYNVNEVNFNILNRFIDSGRISIEDALKFTNEDQVRALEYLSLDKALHVREYYGSALNVEIKYGETVYMGMDDNAIGSYVGSAGLSGMLEICAAYALKKGASLEEAREFSFMDCTYHKENSNIIVDSHPYIASDGHVEL